MEWNEEQMKKALEREGYAVRGPYVGVPTVFNRAVYSLYEGQDEVEDGDAIAIGTMEDLYEWLSRY